MGALAELKLSRTIMYKTIKITTVYDRDRNEWMYGFELSNFTNGTMNSTVFGHAKTSQESLDRAKIHIDKLADASKGPYDDGNDAA